MTFPAKIRYSPAWGAAILLCTFFFPVSLQGIPGISEERTEFTQTGSSIDSFLTRLQAKVSYSFSESCDHFAKIFSSAKEEAAEEVRRKAGEYSADAGKYARRKAGELYSEASDTVKKQTGKLKEDVLETSGEYSAQIRKKSKKAAEKFRSSADSFSGK